jgi:TolA-binding protein
MARGDYEVAKDEFLNTLNAARDEYGAEAKYLLAQIFYTQKEYKQAYETMISLNNDFSTYDQWVGKSFLLLADNFAAQNDIFQARATLQSLIDKFPLESVKEEARKKLKALEQAELEKQKLLEADTLDN